MSEQDLDADYRRALELDDYLEERKWRRQSKSR